MKNTHGGARPGSGPKTKPINLARVAALRKQGLTQAEIVSSMGSTRWVVAQAVKKINSESKQ